MCSRVRQNAGFKRGGAIAKGGGAYNPQAHPRSGEHGYGKPFLAAAFLKAPVADEGKSVTDPWGRSGVKCHGIC